MVFQLKKTTDSLRLPEPESLEKTTTLYYNKRKEWIVLSDVGAIVRNRFSSRYSLWFDLKQ